MQRSTVSLASPTPSSSRASSTSTWTCSRSACGRCALLLLLCRSFRACSHVYAQAMGFNRIYTKKRGEAPDLGDPLVIKTDATMDAIVRPFSSRLFPRFYC